MKTIAERRQYGQLQPLVLERNSTADDQVGIRIY